MIINDEKDFGNVLIEGRRIHEFLKLNKDNFVKNNGRDELIKIAIENHLEVGQTQKMLIFSEKGKLYPRCKRDAIIIHAISKRKSLTELNIELEKYGEIKL